MPWLKVNRIIKGAPVNNGIYKNELHTLASLFQTSPFKASGGVNIKTIC